MSTMTALSWGAEWHALCYAKNLAGFPASLADSKERNLFPTTVTSVVTVPKSLSGEEGLYERH